MGNERSSVVADERDRATTDRAQVTLPAPASPWPMPTAPVTAVGSTAHDGPNVATRPIDRVRRLESPGPIVRRIVTRGDEQANHYRENVDETLTAISADEYDDLDEDTPATKETGYLQFALELGENPDDWDIDTKVLSWNQRVLSARRDFSLPVSCIEAAEHIVAHTGQQATPNWGGEKPTVDLHMSGDVDGETRNVRAANLTEDLLGEKMPDFASFDFDVARVRVGEGLVALDPDEPDTSLHAVAVVAAKRAGTQIIVVERNAGTTSGSTNTLNNDWLLNVYDSPDAFRLSMGAQFLLGKLAVR